MDEVATDQPVTGLPSLLVRLAIGLIGGAALGLTTLFAVDALLGTRKIHDVAYCLGSGMGCLAGGVVVLVICRSDDRLPWVWRTLVSLLCGTGVTFTTLGIFDWLRTFVFRYAEHPKFSYLLGEIGGFSAPGLGLLTCGSLFVYFFVGQTEGNEGEQATSNGTLVDLVPQRHRGRLQFVLYSLLAFLLGTGVVLTFIALTYTALQTNQAAMAIGWPLGSGLGCVTSGAVLYALCRPREGLPRQWPFVVAALTGAGFVLAIWGVVEMIAHFL